MNLDILNEAEKLLDETNFTYKIMRKVQTSSLSLKKSIKDQEKLIQSKLNKCKNIDGYKNVHSFLLKQKKLIQQKINGKEIKHKDILKNHINMIDKYIDIVEKKI